MCIFPLLPTQASVTVTVNNSVSFLVLCHPCEMLENPTHVKSFHLHHCVTSYFFMFLCQNG